MNKYDKILITITKGIQTLSQSLEAVKVENKALAARVKVLEDAERLKVKH